MLRRSLEHIPSETAPIDPRPSVHGDVAAARNCMGSTGFAQRAILRNRVSERDFRRVNRLCNGPRAVPHFPLVRASEPKVSRFGWDQWRRLSRPAIVPQRREARLMMARGLPTWTMESLDPQFACSGFALRQPSPWEHRRDADGFLDG